MNRNYDRQPPAVASQGGIATILVVLMVSLAMTVGALGVMYSVRSNQQIQVAAHANTNAQAAAWAGVEVFRKYLYQMVELQPQSLGYLQGVMPININNLTGNLVNLEAQILNVVVPAGQNPDDTFDITVNIEAKDLAAKASSVVQVTYRVAPYLCAGGEVEVGNTLDFHRDLDMGGGITVHRDESTETSFFVEGEVNMNSISVTGIDHLWATDNVELGSAVYIPQVHTNGWLHLTGGASVGKAYAMGEITTSGGAKVVSEAQSNEDITLAGGRSGDIYSLGGVTNSGAGAMNIQAVGDVSTTNGVIGDIATKGSVNIPAWVTVGNVYAEQNVACVANNWAGYESITAGGTVTNCPADDVVQNGEVTVLVMEELQPFDMEPIQVDAWALRYASNYLFEYVDGKIQVTVFNIHGITNGVYYLGKFLENYNTWYDYLCREVDDNGMCTIPASMAETKTICNGFSAQNSCFSYDENSSTWSINGKNMAPGVVWFEGDVSLGSGEYYNSFIATGDISTSGSHKTYSVNFAGYDVICNNQFLTNSSSNFEGMYPTNLCNTGTGELIYDSIGNLGLLAGGYVPDSEDVYEGGNISLGASTEIFGIVMAGNYLFTGGSTIIHGYISANALGDAGDGGDANRLGGSTTIDLRDLPPSFSPVTVPGMEGGGGNCGIPDNEVSQVYWSKYL